MDGETPLILAASLGNLQAHRGKMRQIPFRTKADGDIIQGAVGVERTEVVS